MIKEYFRAENINEAYQYMKVGAKIIGGGGYVCKHQQGIISVVDLQKLGLTDIEIDKNYIKIGANKKLQAVVENESIPVSLKNAITRFPGSLNIRNSATIAGSILVSDGRFDLLPWLLAAETEVETYPEDNQMPLEKFMQKHKQGGHLGIITKILIPRKANVNWDVISRSPKDAILVGMFINQKNESDEMNVCIAGQDLFPICVSIKKEMNGKKKIIKDKLNNAHSHYNNKYCSFSYFLSMCDELFDRIIGE